MYQIRYTPFALQQLKDVSQSEDRSAIVHRIKELANNPYATRALKCELASYRRARAAGGRYRIFFRIEDAMVRIEFIGMRIPGNGQDAYASFRRMLTENNP